MDRPPAIPALFLAACLAALVFAPGRAAADVLRWVDDEGVVHFTDDRGSIPPSRRGDAVTVIRQSGTSRGSAREAEPPPAPSPPPRLPEEPPPQLLPRDAETPDEPAQLRAKIEAKEAFIRQIDQRRSLAINPYRNRIVNPADMDLYNKYQAELPADRARLRELEAGNGGPR